MGALISGNIVLFVGIPDPFPFYVGSMLVPFLNSGSIWVPCCFYFSSIFIFLLHFLSISVPFCSISVAFMFQGLGPWPLGRLPPHEASGIKVRY